MAGIDNAKTDFATAQPGDVLNTGAERYRFLLLTKAPVWDAHYECWRVCGHRWISTRQTFAKSIIGFGVDGEPPTK